MRFRLIEDDPRLEPDAESVYLTPTLSCRAKGVLAYLRTLPRGTTFDIKTLLSVSTERKQAVSTTLWELERAGYCEIAPEQQEESLEEVHKPGPAPALPLFGSEYSEAQIASPPPLTTADRIIRRLNQLREQSWEWKSYTPLSSRIEPKPELINARLNDGYTETDLVLVLEWLASVDGGKEKSRRYFNCISPFRPSNFERNLALAREWAVRDLPDSKDAEPAQRVIEKLNELRKQAWEWAVYTPLSPAASENTVEISKRLKDGFEESDLLLVLEYLASTEGGKEESRRYFDCITPFNEKNFERNLAMARNWNAKSRPARASSANPGIRRGSDYYEKARKRSNT